MCKRRLKALYRVVEDGFQIIPILHIKPVLSGIGQVAHSNLLLACKHICTYTAHSHNTIYAHTDSLSAA